jgi:enediyne biosynthesis protein E4
MSTTPKPPPPAQAGGVRQLSMVFVFCGVLGSVFFLRGEAPDTNPIDRETALANYGFYLEEVSKDARIRFTHEAPTQLDRRLQHIMPIIVSMGASVSVVDFDRDGLQDLYVITSREGKKNRLYRNKGDGTFEDVADRLGIADLNRLGDGACMGAIWGDFDNDGHEDLFVYRWGKPALFRNRGKDKSGKHLGFEDVSHMLGLPPGQNWINANSAIWLDYNCDGYLDLFVAGYWHEDVNLWHLRTTKIMPESFEYANNGGRKYLLRNLGKDPGGQWLGFKDVTQEAGINSRRWTLAAAATNLRGTGYPDLVLANDYGVNEFFANHGGKDGKWFVEVGKKTGVGDRPKSGMSVSFGDVYNKGQFCIYTTNITEPGVLLQWNNLWVPEPGATGDRLTYRNMAEELGVSRGGWSWGAQFGDLNNDGWQDLVLTNGYISADKRRSYWFPYSRIAGAHKSIISDANNWPAMKGASLAGHQQHCLWLNRRGKFIDVAQALGFRDRHDGRAVALVDLWNRGALDVVQASLKGPLQVYKNTVRADQNWIQFELTGTQSNRSAIGAQLTLHWDGRKQIQEVSGGSGYASQNQRRLHFGLGKSARVEKAVIRWPSGHIQTVHAPKVGELHPISEDPR